MKAQYSKCRMAYRLGSGLAPYHTPTPTAKIYLPPSIHVSNTCRRNVYDYRRAPEIRQVINPTFDNVDSADCLWYSRSLIAL